MCVRTSHGNRETGFMAITGRETQLGRQYLPFKGVLGARTPVAPDSGRLSSSLLLTCTLPAHPSSWFFLPQVQSTRSWW